MVVAKLASLTNEFKFYITCKNRHGISNAWYFFWIGFKNSFLWVFLTEGTRREDSSNWKFQNQTKQLIFFLSQTPESFFGYKYWISYLKLALLLEGQVHFSFWRLQLTRIEYFYGGWLCHYYFLAVC